MTELWPAVLAVLSDALALHMAALTAAVAVLGTVWQPRAAGARRLALAAGLLAALLLALLADQMLLGWAGLAAAVLLLAGSLRTDGAADASWRLLLLGGAGLSLLLLGVLLFALAAGSDAPRWIALAATAGRADAWLTTLGFAFVLLGAVVLAALAPCAGVFGVLLPGVALTIILRARSVVAATPDALAPGPPLLALGLLAVLLAAVTVRRQTDFGRFLAVVAFGQFGVVAFAFGLGDGAAVFAGVLHLTLLTLLLAALLPLAVLPAPPHRRTALTLAAGLVALAGLPPFGLFTSLFLIVLDAARQAPLLAVPFTLGVAGIAWAIAARAVALCRHPEPPNLSAAPTPMALLPAWLLYALVLLLGLAMPGAVVEWLAGIAEAMR